MWPTWLTPLLAVIGMIFSAGVTWGIISYRQKTSENSQTTIVKDLKECVNKLQTVVTEVEVMKVTSARVEKLAEDHTRRIVDLEVTVGKLIPRRKR